MTEVKLGEKFFPGVDTEFDKLGDSSEFGIEITNADTGALIETGVDDNVIGDFAEIMWTDPATTGTSAGAENVIGKSIVAVASGHTFVAGQRFDDAAGNLYYITKVEAEAISIKGELVADIADATDLVSVGNTGIYKIDVTLAAEAEYFVSMNHPEFGHISSKYKVVGKDNGDIYTRLDEGLNKLGSTGSMIAVN